MWFGKPEIEFIKGIVERIVSERLAELRARIERLEEKTDEL